MTTPRVTRPPRAALVLLVAVATGCAIGGPSTSGTIMRDPAGIRLLLDTPAGRVVGELLEVSPDGLLVRMDRGASTAVTSGIIVRVPADLVPPTIRAGTDQPAGTERGRIVSFRDEEDRAWLQGFSRFPYGMSADVERRLLEANGESAIAVLRSPAGTGENRAAGFLTEVVMGTWPFQDRSEAIQHGYRKVGPDFPGMGEHWVNPGRVLSGGVDASRPQILTYVEVDGVARLTGAAFAVPLAEHESVPEGPVDPAAWHDHEGSLDEEALVLESPHSAGHGSGGPRLAMFHVWLWPENPGGPFAQNNWALPWVRVGVPPPARTDPELARALSLAGGGEAYYRMLLTRAAGLERPPAEEVSQRGFIESAVSRAARRVEEALGSRDRAEGPLDPREVEDLRRSWIDLWAELERDLHPDVWKRLAPAYRAWSGQTERERSELPPHR